MATKRITATPQRTDFDFDDFLAAGYRVRQAPPVQEQAPPEPEKPSVARRIGDTAVQFGQGAVTGVKMMSDIFGANNAVSSGLSDVNQALDGLLSATAQNDKQKIAQIMQEAEGKGWGEQIIAGLKAAGVDPVGLAANALGTSLPTMATMLIPGAGPVAVATRMGAGVAMGAGQGVGSVKGQIYDETKRKWLETGATPEQAEAKAQEAAAYGGANTDQMAIGGVLGMGSVLGAERALGKVLHGAGKAGPGMLGRVATTTAAETGTEMLQGGQEKFATNTALNRQGFDVDPMSGVIANATLEGAAAAPMGAIAGIPRPAVTPAQAAADTIRATETLPESGPMTRASNAATEAKAQAVEAGAPVDGQIAPNPAPDPVDDPVRDQILALPDGTRQDALRAYAVVNRTDVAKGVVQYNRKLLDRLLTENAPPPVVGESLTGTDMGAMLGGGGMTGNADPLAGALGMGREAQANSITNVAQAAENRPPMPASDASRMLDEARNQGVELAVAEHPSGGFVLVPPQWVSPDVAAQGETRLAETIARMQQADAAPVERAQRTSTAPVDLNLPTDPVQNYMDTLRTVNTPAAQAFVRDFDAGRITPTNVQQRMVVEQGKTPDQLIAQAAAEAPTQADPVAERLARAAAQGASVPAPTDILNPVGLPFKTRMAADRAAKQTPGAVVPVEGGFVVRPQEPVNVQDVPQAPEVPQAAAVISPPSQAPQAVGAQPAGPAAGVPAEGAGAVEAAGLTENKVGRKDSAQIAQPENVASEAGNSSAQPAAPIRLGRNNTPLNEGGKPFKTRKAAGDAKKLQPMMRVVTVPGGYALADKTPAQLAAEAMAARRLATPRTSARGEPIPAHAFVAAAGGLNPVAASDLGVDGNPRIGNRRLFSGQGRGLSMDQATQMLVADGYLSEGATVNDAFALIKKSLTQPQYNADGIERMAEAESMARFEDYLAAQDDEFDPFGPAPATLDGFSDDMLESSGYDAATDAIKAEVRALLEMANAQGVDTESIMFEAHEQTRNATEQDYYEAAKSALEAAIAGSNQDRGTPAGSEGQGPGPAAASAAEQGVNQPEALDRQEQAATENVAPAVSTTVDMPPTRQQESSPFAPFATGRYRISIRDEGNGPYAQVVAIQRGSGVEIEMRMPGEALEHPAFSQLNARVQALFETPTASMFDAEPPALELAAQTPAEAAARQDAQEQADKAEAAAKRAEDAAAKAEEERKRIAQASVRAADNFELGQDPLDSLTGQQDVFADAPEATENAANDEKDGRAQQPMPAFDAYNDAMDWAKARAKSMGMSFIAYRSTDEFKNGVSQQLESLYKTHKAKWDADTAEAGKAMQAAMAQAGIRPGDTVEWVQSGAFLSQDRMSGVVRLDSNGVPQVHMGSEIAVAKPGGKIGYTKKLRWQDYMKKSGEAGKREQNQPEAPAKQAQAATEAVAPQPITRADVTAAQQQAATAIAERIDAMSAQEVQKIAARFLPTMGVKVPGGKARIKAAMADPKVNLQAAADEVGAVLAGDVKRALQADVEGRVEVGDATESEAPKAKPESAKAESGEGAAPKSATKIEDFGETLHGARKMIYAEAYADGMAKAKDLDIKAHPLSKTWPEPDYQKLLEGGAPLEAVSIARALREAVPTKPQSSWKLKGWSAQVETLRGFAEDVLAGQQEPSAVRIKLNRDGLPRGIADKVALYEAMGHERSLKGIDVSVGRYSMYDRVEYNPPRTIWSVSREAKGAFGNWPRELAKGDTREEAIAAFKKRAAELLAEESAPTKGATFEIYGKRAGGAREFFIGKKIGRNVAELKTGFADIKAARQYLADNQTELEGLLDKYKAVPPVRNGQNAPRIGEDYRKGANVTPEQFQEAFSFRGVQFGNYVESGRRQQDLNRAYDAMMDLAGVLNLPPKALSLGGRLGLAFGARGSGGTDAAAAHYEPDTVVINLTKREGAGSLAHEWWHGLDNYFGKQRDARGEYGNPSTFLTETASMKDAHPGGTRREMMAAFHAVMSAINLTGMQERSRKLDDRRTKEYWTTKPEMSARAFESYVIAKLQDQNAGNDYLANVLPASVFALEGAYPYPTAGELPQIRGAFDAFFQTVQTKEDDAGNVAMFSRASAGFSPEEAVAMFNQATPPNPYPHKLQATLAAAKHGASAVQADNGGWLLAPKAQAYTAQELQDAQQRIDRLNRALKKHNNVTPAAVLSDAPTPAMAWGRSIARTLGYNVTFIQPNPDFHGVAVGGDAFVSASANHPEIGLIGHEVLHSLKQSSPDIYQALAERIRPYLKDGVVDAKRRWEDANGGRDTSMAHAEEEVLADLNGAMWLDPKFWREMAKNDQSLFRQVAYKFMEVATKAMQGLSRFKADSLVTDVDAVREIIAQEWAYQAQEMGNPSEFAASDSPAFSRKDADTAAALRELAADARAPGNANKTVVLGPLSAVELEILQREGILVDGEFTHAADMFAVRHALNRHSDAKVEQSRGQIPITEEDVALVADAIKAPTAYVLGGKTPRGQDVVGTIKRLNDGTLLYLEEVRTGRKTLAMTSMRKYPGTTDFDTIANSVLPSNAQSDTGDVRIVYPEGGPGQGPDPANPDIRFSRATAAGDPVSAWDAPINTGFDDLIYKLQDKNIDLKRVVEAITKSVGAVSDNVNAYLKEELFHKRAAKRVADFGARELKPLMNQMRLAGLSMEDVEEYLHARHAKEANAVIAERNPDSPGLQDGGSGMTNQAADNYFAKLDPAQRRKLEAVATKVDAIIADTRKLYVSYGLEDQAVVDGWANLYQHYIPLQREDKEGGMGIGQGFSVKGKETKGRTGSTRKVVDILANIASQREKLIVRGEKNRVTQALLGLAQANPNPEFWEVRSQAPTERVFDPKTGVVVDRPDPLFRSRDNVVVAKVKDSKGNVTEQMVVFNEDNPRALRMAAALKNLDMGNLEGLLGVSAKITRYFSAINTQYNPVFGVVNLVRDVQGAMVNLAATPLAGKQAKIAKDTLSALRGIYSDIRKTRKGGQATSQWAQLWEQMQDDGGTTGYRDLFKTSADRAENLKSILNPEKWMDSKWGKFFTADGRLRVPLSVAQKHTGALLDWLSDYNEAMENGVRLAAYKAALDQGMSREQAASLAKNLTVNFNRKGQVGQQAGAVYAFFNAAMQGTARIGQTLFDMDGGDVKTLRLSKTGKAVVYGGVMLGVMQALALAGAGFDDEDPPEFVRERSLIIPTGGKTYITIPMPLGLHVIPGIGRHATEFALSGFDKPAKRAVSVVGMFADAFNPIGNAGLSMQTLAPTALDPLVALTENKDWTGKPIARTSFNKAMPGHTQWKDTATGFSKVVAEAINWVSGGNEYVAGAFSPTPDQIDYLLAQVGGGVAREAAKVQQTVSAALSGEELPTYKVPLLGRFVGNAASQASQGTEFYSNLNKLNELETEIKGLRKDGKYDEAAKLVRENPQASMIVVANRAEREVQRLRREKRELIAKDASRAAVRAKEAQITAVMTRMNEAAERRKALAAH